MQITLQSSIEHIIHTIRLLGVNVLKHCLLSQVRLGCRAGIFLGGGGWCF